MPADDAIATGAGRCACGGLLESGDVVTRIRHLSLDPGCQRPMSESEATAQTIESVIDAKHHSIDGGSQPAAERTEPDEIVELVSVKYQHAPPVSSAVDQATMYLDPAKVEAAEVTQEVVVIAGHVDDAASVSRVFQQRLQNLLMLAGPEERALHGPDVDQVADDEDVTGLDRAEEVEQLVCAAAAIAEMDVRNEYAAHLHVHPRLVCADDGLMTFF